jgi:hypothetical protein
VVIICPSREDHGVDFPHYVVTAMTTVAARDHSVRLLSSAQFIICCHCGHWSARMVPTCICREGCHNASRSPKRYESVT